jgi:hypothetical protein
MTQSELSIAGANTTTPNMEKGAGEQRVREPI